MDSLHRYLLWSVPRRKYDVVNFIILATSQSSYQCPKLLEYSFNVEQYGIINLFFKPQEWLISLTLNKKYQIFYVGLISFNEFTIVIYDPWCYATDWRWNLLINFYMCNISLRAFNWFRFTIVILKSSFVRP